MSYQSVVLADNPTFLWLLADTSGVVAADATGNGNIGNYTGGYTQGVPGPPGVDANAVLLNGSTGFVYTNSNYYSSAFSAEIWFNSTSPDGGTIMQGNAWLAILGDDGKITYVVYNGAVLISCESSGSYGDGNWHYVAVTYDGSLNAVLYVDGVEVASAVVTPSMANSPGSPVYSTGYGSQSVSTSDLLAGTVSAFADYPYALTSGQVTTHYDAAIPPSGSAEGQAQPLTARVWGRRTEGRGNWRGNSVNAVLGIRGSFQPRATVPTSRRSGTRSAWREVRGAFPLLGKPVVGGTVRRRSATRVAWKSVKGTLPPAIGKPATGGFVERRRAARGAWNRVLGPFPLLGRAERGGVVVPRHSQRAVWRGVRGTLPPAIGIPFVGGFVTRRNGVRGMSAHVAGAHNATAVPASPLVGGFVARRRYVRGSSRGADVPVIRGRAVTGGVVCPRRGTSIRGSWGGVNGPEIRGVANIGGCVARHPRIPRVPCWRGTIVRTVNVIPPRGTVPPRVFVMRRRGVGVVWRGVVPVGVNQVIVFGPAMQIVLGPLGLDWQTGAVGFDWQTGVVGVW
jgi:hypothetical protein